MQWRELKQESGDRVLLFVQACFRRCIDLRVLPGLRGANPECGFVQVIYSSVLHSIGDNTWIRMMKCHMLYCYGYVLKCVFWILLRIYYDVDG